MHADIRIYLMHRPTHVHIIHYMVCVQLYMYNQSINSFIIILINDIAFTKHGFSKVRL